MSFTIVQPYLDTFCSKYPFQYSVDYMSDTIIFRIVLKVSGYQDLVWYQRVSMSFLQQLAEGNTYDSFDQSLLMTISNEWCKILKTNTADLRHEKPEPVVDEGCPYCTEGSSRYMLNKIPNIRFCPMCGREVSET